MILVGVTASVLLAAAAILLDRRRRHARRQRLAAGVRVALLETARTLPGRDLPEAARMACRGLCALGFDAAAVSVRRGPTIVPLHLEGLPGFERPLPVDDSFAGRALTENRTVVITDYANLPQHLPERAEVRSVVLAPVRVDGRPAATLSAVRRRVAEPTAQEVAIVETLAVHLGRAFEIESQVAAQQELLDRMQRLEHMRSAFVGRVTADLRDRLAVVRELASALDTATELTADHRGAVLDDLLDQAHRVRDTIDALLDFSRFQSDRREPTLVPIRVPDLLAPLRRSGAIDLGTHGLGPDDYVHVDAELVRHALELLLAGRSDPEPLSVRVDQAGVILLVGDGSSGALRHDGGLIGSLAGQLLLAGGATAGTGDELAVHLPWWREA